MSRLRPYRLLGIAVLGLATLSMGTRPALHAQQAPAAASAAFVGGAFGGGAKSEPVIVLPEPYHVEAPPKTVEELKTYFKLQDKVVMNFPENSTLDDVVKFIRKVTIDEKAGFPQGVPIYVDPLGLQDADKTLSSTVHFEFDGMRLEKGLRLILKQLSLTYEIDKDGLITITATASDDSKPMSNEFANWHAFDLLRAEIHALREEVRDLRLLQGAPNPTPARLPEATPPRGGMGGGFR